MLYNVIMKLKYRKR